MKDLGERSKKQKHSQAIQHQAHSSPPVLNYSLDDQISNYGEIATTETWTETALPSLIPGALGSHFFSHQSSTLNTIPGELYTPQQYLELSGLNNDQPSFSNPPEMLFNPETQVRSFLTYTCTLFCSEEITNVGVCRALMDR